MVASAGGATKAMEGRVTKFGIGQPVSRLEDPRFITGRGRYVDDINLPQQCYGVVVMSPHAHARIKSIDVSRAKAAAGVIAVLTGADVQADKLGSLKPVMPEDMGGPKGYRTLRAILASDKVRAVGDRVAFVVAETAAAGARRRRTGRGRVRTAAGGRIARGCDQTRRAGGVGRGADNVAVTLMMGSKEATDAAFGNAKHVVSVKLVNNRVNANSIEPRAAIGQYHPDSASYTLYATSQNPHGHRAHLAGDVLKVAQSKLRVISPDVGGGFGMKGAIYPEDALVLWASRRCGGRPVKWVATRSEVVPRRLARPRSDRHRRTRARRRRQDSRLCASTPSTPWARMCSMLPSWCRCLRSSSRPASTIFPRCCASARAVLTNTPPLQPFAAPAGRKRPTSSSS